MKITGWLFTVALVGSAAYGLRGGCLDERAAPDEELAQHFDQLCDIARDHIETPEKGVRKLGRYLSKHTEDMFGDFGATLAVIEGVSDDRKHDDRARLARDRIQRPLRTCETDWQRFGEAVEADPAASALVDRFAVRLNRTFEIILSSRDLELRTLARRLIERFER